MPETNFPPDQLVCSIVNEVRAQEHHRKVTGDLIASGASFETLECHRLVGVALDRQHHISLEELRVGLGVAIPPGCIPALAPESGGTKINGDGG